MAIRVVGSSEVADVDGTDFRALRVTGRPVNYGNFGIFSIGASSGTMATSLAANSEIFQFRQPLATSLAMVRKIEMSAGALSVGVAALLSFRMTAARAWTTAGSGGSTVVITGNNAKLRTVMQSSLVNNLNISTTGALTVGTKTLDSTDLMNVAFGLGTGAVATQMNRSFLDPTRIFNGAGPAGEPLILAQDEGFVIRTGNAFGNNPTWIFSVTATWTEAGVF